ncbi:MAG TPA: hypothetical protein GXX19_03240 [Syntrophomonadaceae bacterium]|nr:hypothetical protein [Syntrophomonadaceae bacterium]
MAIEKLFDEIKKLSLWERKKILEMLEGQVNTGKDIKEFIEAAGSWTDFDEESFIKDVYSYRQKLPEREEANW